MYNPVEEQSVSALSIAARPSTRRNYIAWNVAYIRARYPI